MHTYVYIVCIYIYIYMYTCTYRWDPIPSVTRLLFVDSHRRAGSGLGAARTLLWASPGSVCVIVL